MSIFRHRDKIISILLINIILVYAAGCGHKPRVLLIGIDGASWNVITPLIQEGKLPNIKKLVDKGCWGGLRSASPFYSEVIWTSIATGKIPIKNGITDRLMQDPDTNISIPPSSNLKKAKSIWNILSENNKRVGVVNFMVTWPAEKVNGIMVSDRVLDVNDLDYFAQNRSYPDFAKICSPEEFGRFKYMASSILSGIDKNRFPGFWWSIENVDSFMVNLSKYLLKNKNFDFFCLYIRGIDVVSHNFWKFLHPENFNVNQDEIQRYKNLINDYYIWADRQIGGILKKAGKESAVFIVSDHGFHATPRNSSLFSRVDYLLEISNIKRIAKGSRTAILENDPMDIHSFEKNIKISGDLSEKEFSGLREKAKLVLKKIKVKETGDSPFAKLEDTKSGFLIKAPKRFLKEHLDCHLLINNKEYKIRDLFIDNIYSGEHSNPGVIIISGRYILRNKEIAGATVYDLAPTILYYMGFPVPRDMDGKVLVEAVEKNYLHNHPLAYIDTYETNKNEIARKPIRSPLDEERMKEKMRSLGYIN